MYLALSAMAVVGSASGSVFSIERYTENRRPPGAHVAAPSLDSLNRALHRADAFIGGLYRPIDGRMSVTSEYYGAPIRAYFPERHRWVLAG
jgi:hypothetical protein